MKNERREAILELIKQNPIETQEDLIIELKNCGFDVTQSTVSRDIKLLGLIKIQNKNKVYRYSAPTVQGNDNELQSDNHERLMSVFKRSVISVEYAMNNLVIKCYSGMAQGACVAFDTLYSDMFIGTLAGEDTIIAITKDEPSAAELAKKLTEVVG